MDLAKIPFIQARFFTSPRRQQIRQIVLHSTEGGSSAEAVTRWFAGPTSPQASTHYTTGPDGIWQGVRDLDEAWTAGHGLTNQRSINIEQIGWAKWSRNEWLEADTVSHTAQLVDHLCGRYAIPKRRLSLDEVRSGTMGVCSHYDVTLAFSIYGGHTDPGPGFPWDKVLGGTVPTPEPTPAPVVGIIGRGSQGGAVREWQTRLRDRGYDIAADGIYGIRTESITRDFQSARGIVSDGIVGPASRSAMTKAEKAGWKVNTSPVWPGRLLSVGSQGADVRQFQQRMRDRGWGIDVDGIYGPQTRAVVVAFQAEKRLQTDGIVGAQTWRAAWEAPIT